MADSNGCQTGLLEGVCLECQSDSDVERPLTFRAPAKIEAQTMTVDEELSKWVAEK
jgi:hypothetical protein